MSSFSAEWLAAREPHDAAARAVELVGLLRARELMTQTGSGTPDAVARAIVDLGAGSGANLRWLLPRLGGVQAWQLIEWLSFIIDFPPIEVIVLVKASLSIDEDKLATVSHFVPGRSGRAFVLLYTQQEAFADQVIDLLALACQEEPALGVGAEPGGIFL